MGKITINDWQTIQSRKEIQNIRRIVSSDKSINWSIVFELFLIFLGFCVDNIWGKEDAPDWLWIILSIIGFVVPLGVFCYGRYSQKEKKESEKQVRAVHEMITMFDDELCYYVMTAGSLLDSKPDDSVTHGNDENELLRFYFIEASYYLNKSVSILYLMLNNFENLIEPCGAQNMYHNSKIAFYRFQNVLLLMSTMYKKIDTQLSNCDNMHEVLTENHWYIDRLNEVISEGNSALGANIGTITISEKSK